MYQGFDQEVGHQGSHFFNYKGVFLRHSLHQQWRGIRFAFSVSKEYVWKKLKEKNNYKENLEAHNENQFHGTQDKKERPFC